MNKQPSPRDILLHRAFKSLTDSPISRDFRQEFLTEITRVEEYIIEQVALKRLIKDLKFT